MIICLSCPDAFADDDLFGLCLHVLLKHGAGAFGQVAAINEQVRELLKERGLI